MLYRTKIQIFYLEIDIESKNVILDSSCRIGACFSKERVTKSLNTIFQLPPEKYFQNQWTLTLKIVKHTA